MLDIYYLKVHGVPGVDYIFKKPANELLVMDPDLQTPYDVIYAGDSEAKQVIARGLNECEVLMARRFVLDSVLKPRNADEPHPLIGVETIAIDRSAPLATFGGEGRLLRILQSDIWTSDSDVEELSFAVRSSRVDGARVDERLFYRRSPTDGPVPCYAVTARRAGPLPARVVARYGHWMQNKSGPRSRAERFKFLEWSYPPMFLATDNMVSACRLLSREEAEVIASQMSESFSDVRIVSGAFREMDASEGMFVTDSQAFSQAMPETERDAGFPYFLSVFPEQSE